MKAEKSKMSIDQKSLIKAHNERKNGLNLRKKGGNYSSLPLFDNTIQLDLFNSISDYSETK